MKSIIAFLSVLAATTATPVEVELSPFRAMRSLHTSPSYELQVRSNERKILKKLKVYPSRSPVFQFGMQYVELGAEGARQRNPMDHELKDIHENLYTDGKASLLIRDGKVSGILDHEHSIRFSDEGAHKLHPLSRSPKGFTDVVNLNFTTTPAIGGLSDDPIKVEVWVILDYDHAKQFDFDQTKILEYLGPFFHGINTRYAAARDDWDIQFLIAGLTVITDKSQQPWLEDNSGGDGTYDLPGTLNAIATAVENGELPQADLVALITNTEMVADGDPNVAGQAFLKGVCRNLLGYTGTSVTEDRHAYFGGVHSVAHEFGHNMGAPHDGNKDIYFPETEPCPWEDGYVMSYALKDANHFHFSQCSKDLINEVINSQEAACIKEKNVPAPVMEDPNSSKLPGSLVTMDEACKKETQDPSATADIDESKPSSAQCQRLWCNVGGDLSSRGAPEEGTVCGNGGVCKSGICVGEKKRGIFKGYASVAPELQAGGFSAAK